MSEKKATIYVLNRTGEALGYTETIGFAKAYLRSGRLKEVSLRPYAVQMVVDFRPAEYESVLVPGSAEVCKAPVVQNLLKAGMETFQRDKAAGKIDDGFHFSKAYIPATAAASKRKKKSAGAQNKKSQDGNGKAAPAARQKPSKEKKQTGENKASNDSRLATEKKPAAGLNASKPVQFAPQSVKKPAVQSNGQSNQKPVQTDTKPKTDQTASQKAASTGKTTSRNSAEKGARPAPAKNAGNPAEKKEEASSPARKPGTAPESKSGAAGRKAAVQKSHYTDRQIEAISNQTAQDWKKLVAYIKADRRTEHMEKKRKVGKQILQEQKEFMQKKQAGALGKSTAWRFRPLTLAGRYEKAAGSDKTVIAGKVLTSAVQYWNLLEAVLKQTIAKNAENPQAAARLQAQINEVNKRKNERLSEAEEKHLLRNARNSFTIFRRWLI